MARIIDTSRLTPESIERMDQNVSEWVYNGLDCAVTHEIIDALLPQLNNTTAGTYAFSRALQAPILEMSLRGVRVDLIQRDRVTADFKKKMSFIEENLNIILREGLGWHGSWRSPAQLKDLFYGVMEYPSIKKRRPDGTFGPTVNREALEQLSTNFHAEPICLHILALRDIAKKLQFLETGIDADGRIRTSFNIAGTNTGRLASSESAFGTGTNLQNVDRDLRSVLIPDPGYKFCNLDLEQGDARNVGAICWNLFSLEDEKFAGAYLDACESGDLHTEVCRMSWTDKPWTSDPKANRLIAEEIAYRQDSFRQLAKKLGHGTNYYGTPGTMARHTKVDRKQIETFQRRYFKAFPAIGNYDRDHSAPCWHNSVRSQLKDTGVITSLLGRRRVFWGRPNDDSTLREAIAYEPQSLTADEIDTGMLALWRAEICQLLLQVHDSILFQYPAHLESTIVPQAIELLKVPIELAKGRRFLVPVDAKVGWNWGDAGDTNPHGLAKWKGYDDRQAPARSTLF